MKLDPNAYVQGHSGMTVRAEIAAKVLQAMLASPDYRTHTSQQLVNAAANMADDLIEELNK